jgi:SAM-dependent methyltransferase
MSLRKLLLIPQLIWYGVRAPRDQAKAWDRFWAGIRRTGPGGEVLWDAASKEELDGVLARVTTRMDAGLPVVDVGCGNGRFSRLLAARFPRVLGIDVSPQAIERAKEESRGVENVSYRVLDASAPGVGRSLAGELGEVNVLMRGVFHVFDAGQRARAVENLAAMMGERGVIYCAETNYEGDPLDQLVTQGATPTTMPEPLRKCIEAGIKPPPALRGGAARGVLPERSVGDAGERAPRDARGAVDGEGRGRADPQLLRHGAEAAGGVIRRRARGWLLAARPDEVRDVKRRGSASGRGRSRRWSR